MEWNDVKKSLNKKYIYYLWTVKRYKSTDRFFLVTCTKLLTLKFTSDGWVYSLIHGYQGHADEFPEEYNGEMKPVIRFGVFPLYYIKNSPRNRVGWIRPQHKIDESEESVPADISLELAVYPENRHQDHTGQIAKYGRYLESLGREGCTFQTNGSDIVYPEFYLARSMSKAGENLEFRGDKDTRRALENHPDYDISKDPNQNEKDLMMLFAQDAGMKRIAFPWRYFIGQGVPVASPVSYGCEIFGHWYARPARPEKNLYQEDTGVVINLGPKYHV